MSHRCPSLTFLFPFVPHLLSSSPQYLISLLRWTHFSSVFISLFSCLMYLSLVRIPFSSFRKTLLPQVIVFALLWAWMILGSSACSTQPQDVCYILCPSPTSHQIFPHLRWLDNTTSPHYESFHDSTILLSGPLKASLRCHPSLNPLPRHNLQYSCYRTLYYRPVGLHSLSIFALT